VGIAEIAEIMDKTKLENAKMAALREFLYQLNPCRSRSGGCWEWRRYTFGGYGYIIFDGFKFSVHRLSFEHYKGIIPCGMEVMHTCDNRCCYNPDHLYLGSHADNMQDMARKGRGRQPERRTHARPPLTNEELARAVEKESYPGSPYFRSQK